MNLQNEKGNLNKVPPKKKKQYDWVELAVYGVFILIIFLMAYNLHQEISQDKIKFNIARDICTNEGFEFHGLSNKIVICMDVDSNGKATPSYYHIDRYRPEPIANDGFTISFWTRLDDNGEWHHIAFIGDRTYLDGQIYFDGTIDEVMIWNRSLTTSEIKRIYDTSWN